MILTVPTSAKTSPDCLSQVLNFIGRNGSKRKDKEILINIALYNDDLYKEFSKFPEEEWQKIIDTNIDRYADYDASFNSVQFKPWLKKNPGSFNKDTNIGDYFTERLHEFSKKHSIKRIENITADLADETTKLAKKCRNEQGCIQRGIAKYLNRLENFCLRKQPKYIQDMSLSMAVSVAGYYHAYKKNPEDGYPYDLLINNLFWTPIIAERNCRATIGAEKLGQRIDFNQPVTKKEFWSRAKRSYASYMSVSPLYSGSYIGLNITRELITGKKEIKAEDVTWDNFLKWSGEYSKQIASMYLYDMAIAVPRNVLILDPINRSFAPRLQTKFAYQEKYSNLNNPNLSSIPKWLYNKHVYSKIAIGIPQAALKGYSIATFKDVFRWAEGVSDESFMNTHFNKPFESPTPATKKSDNQY